MVIIMKEYLSIFIDKEYPTFLDKYFNTNTLKRIKEVTQFCGCDYTKLYSPLFFYTRFDHSLVVAHMTWHFTHDKKQTIAALLHDIGTPCFAHTIDYVFGDYMKQESSEKQITDLIMKDKELLNFLREDGISIKDLEDLSKYPILENKSPKLCTDRLDGVLHTCYIWLHTNTLEEIKEVYDDMTVLTNEDGNLEIGFSSINIANQFVKMNIVYAKELQGNKDKYVMKYISEIVKKAVANQYITLEDLYHKKESEIIDVFRRYFPSWKSFEKVTSLVRTEDTPTNFYVSFQTKKRNTIPLVRVEKGSKRITDISEEAYQLYQELKDYKDTTYAYTEEIGCQFLD